MTAQFTWGRPSRNAGLASLSSLHACASSLRFGAGLGKGSGLRRGIFGAGRGGGCRRAGGIACAACCGGAAVLRGAPGGNFCRFTSSQFQLALTSGATFWLLQGPSANKLERETRKGPSGKQEVDAPVHMAAALPRRRRVTDFWVSLGHTHRARPGARETNLLVCFALAQHRCVLVSSIVVCTATALQSHVFRAMVRRPSFPSPARAARVGALTVPCVSPQHQPSPQWATRAAVPRHMRCVATHAA